MASVLRIRTYLFRLKASRAHPDSPAPAVPRSGRERRTASESAGAKDDSLNRWEVDGGVLHKDG